MEPSTYTPLPNIPLHLAEGTHLVDREDGTYVCVGVSGHPRLILSKAEAHITKQLNGVSISEIAQTTYEENEQVSFSLIIKLVKKLVSAQLIQEHAQLDSISPKGKDPDGPKMRLFELDVSGHQKGKPRISEKKQEQTKTIFSQNALVLIGSLLFALTLGLWVVDEPSSGSLVPGGDPLLGALLAYCSLSLMVTARYTLLALIGRYAGKASHPWRLRIYSGILAIDTGSTNIEYCHRMVRASAWLSTLVVPFMCIALVALGHLLAAPDSVLVNDMMQLLKTVAWGFLLLEMCPYLPTSTGRLYQCLSERVEESDRGLAYLRRRLLRRTFLGDFFDGERVLILWATLSFFWTILAFKGVFSLNEQNLVPLMVSLGSADAFRVAAVIAQVVILTCLVLVVTAGFLVLLGNFIWGSRELLYRPRRIREMGSLNSADLALLLKDVPIFQDCDDDEISEIVKKLNPIGLSPGRKIISQGDKGSTFYVLAAGEADVIQETPAGGETIVARLGAGDTFGEQSLLSDAPRTASIVAVTDGMVLELDRESFRAVVKEKSMATVRDLVQGATLLHRSPFFRDLPPDVVEQLLRQVTLESFEANQTVFKQGDQGEHLYIILEGEFSVETDGKNEAVAVLKRGELFGEIAIMANVPRTASVTARTAGKCYTLQRDAFYSFLSKNMMLGVRMEELAAMRLNEGERQ